MRKITVGALRIPGMSSPGRWGALALLVGALIALGTLAALTVAVVQSQARAREDALERFHDRGRLAAQLLAGAMAQSSTRQGADAQLRLSGRVSAATLRAWEGESDPAIPYTALYDDRGRQLAIYPAGSQAVATPSAQAALRVATGGRPATSGVTSSVLGPIIETFVPFPAGDGVRVLLVAFPLELTAQFAAGALRDAAGTPTGGAFVLDRSGKLVTAVGDGSKLPGVAEAVSAAATRSGRPRGQVGSNRFVVNPVQDTGLVVALAAPETELTASLPAVAWPRLALAGFGLALLAVFWLTARVLRGARRLEAARREAERANEAKSRFLAHISHELRQPLAAISGFAELLQRRSTATEEEQQWTGHILQGGQHLLALVNELQEIARIEAGKITLAIEPVDVRSTVAEILSLVAPLASERRIRLEPPGSSSSAQRALADPLRLKQVLLNLLSNAIKYNREAGTVSVSVAETGRGTVRVAVTDTGEGIPPDALENLFSPFDRLGAEQGPVVGSGLGLVVTKGLIEAMHGHLDVESELGTGTTFAFELPAAKAAEQKKLAPVPTPTASRVTAGNVLYIEDDPANLQLVENILAEARPRLELRTATEGEAGAALAEQHSPDLLLLDLNLPDMKGEQVIRRLRARPETADLPILVLSADSTSRNVTRLLQTGADAYLTKPLDVPRFIDIVDRLLSAR